MISYEDFEKVDIRVGKIIKVEDFPEARKPLSKYVFSTMVTEGVGEIGYLPVEENIRNRGFLRSEATPAYKLTIDFGSEIGIKKSSVQIVKNYTKEELLGMQIIGVVNFPAKQIGPFVSEVLTLGLPDENGEVVLLIPTKEIPLGGRMF